MPFNSVIDRSGAEALIPQEVSYRIMGMATAQSAVLSLATRLPNMTRKQLRMPVLNSLPMAYFVNGDTGLKQTSKVDWANKFINAEEIAVIVPIPDAVLDDAAYDLWAQIQPLVAQAFGQVIDGALLYSLNKPASWEEGIVPGATAKGNVIALGTNDTYYLDIMGTGGLIAMVEKSGYTVKGYVGSTDSRAMLRDIVDTTGRPIFRTGMTDTEAYRLDGQAIVFPENGSIDPAQSMLIAGDFKQLVYAIRQDMTVKRLTEAVITDNDGKIIYNLPQQDMTALRFVMRMGWALPNTINNIQPDATKRYPFAVLTP